VSVTTLIGTEPVQLKDTERADVSSPLVERCAAWEVVPVEVPSVSGCVFGNVVVSAAHAIELLLVIFPICVFVRLG